MNFIASPEIVMAFALAGRLSFNPLTDSLVGADGRPFRLEPPPTAPDVPDAPFERGDAKYIAPSSSDVDIRIDPRSQRLERLHPWPAWDGHDFEDLPILIKTREKTTTDQISPAGPWLRLRGHLDKFSDNLLAGATNAFTGATGTATHAFTGEAGMPVSAIARDYRSRHVRWVVVGDHNYGEGSSREHAALSPRWLNGAAVIARSFARIHESNLKKQGLLALTFDDAGDYDRVREGDRVSLVGLDALAPGRTVECRLCHADGTTETLRLCHSYGAKQIEWFRAGSALNAIRWGRQGGHA